MTATEPDPLATIRAAAAERAEALAAAADTDGRLRDAIRAASAAGHAYPALIEASGLSRARISQIVRGSRT